MSWGPSFQTGQEGAEPDGLRRPLRMTRAVRNLVKAAGGALAAGLLLMWVLSEGEAERVTPTTSASVVTSPFPVEATAEDLPPAGAVTAATPIPDSEDFAGNERAVSYAISLVELPGLPPDAGPGTRFDLWVTWEPPITRRPRVQLLLRDVVLERIAEPVTRDGPYVAMLAVDERHLADLLYGDRYGDFNAAVLAAR